MRVLLAGPGIEENLSIRYLASSLQAKRHEASLALFNSADDVETVAEQAGEAEVVGLSVCFQSRGNFSPWHTGKNRNPDWRLKCADPSHLAMYGKSPYTSTVRIRWPSC
jgi:hypothetical protein